MINKKLVHFNNYDDYVLYKKSGELLNTSIIFISEDESIDTHDTLYKMVNWGKIIPSIISATDWEIVSLDASSTIIEPCETTITITGLAQRTVYWSDENVSIETAIPRFTVSYGELVEDTLTIPANVSYDEKIITITATYENASNSIQITQKGDYVETYEDITLTVDPVSDIPASGGTVTTNSTAIQNVVYKSGSAGTIAIPVTEQSISADSKSIYPSDRTLVDTVTVSVSNGDKSASQSVEVYLQANVKTLSSISIQAGLPDNTWHSTNWSNIPASGHYLGVYGYYNYTFTSEETSSEFLGNLGSGLTFTTSMAEAWVNGGLHVLSRGTTSGNARTGTVYWTSAGKTSNTLSYTLSHNNPTSSDSGGVTTYGNVSAGAISNKTIGAGGGSATATAGNGSQSWSKSAVIRTYKWPSGAPNTTSTVTAASSGTNTIAPSRSSYSASANSKGTTVSGVTTVGSASVTWSGSGGKSASGTMYIYQAANSLLYYKTKDSTNKMPTTGTYSLSNPSKSGNLSDYEYTYMTSGGNTCTISVNNANFECRAHYSSGSDPITYIRPVSITAESGDGLAVEIITVKNDPSTGTALFKFTYIDKGESIYVILLSPTIQLYGGTGVYSVRKVLSVQRAI